MGPLLKIFILLYVFADLQGVRQVPWLPCQFTDERVTYNKEKHIETQRVHREAMLQFGQKGDTPVNPHAITFLITASRLNLRKHLESVKAEELECELRRYSTEGNYIRWPALGAKGYNRWYSSTIKHSKGLFTVTGFLRQVSDQPPPGKQDFHSWPAIADTEILTTAEPPRVSINTGAVLSLLNGAEQKVVCEADGYYPLDVEIVWTEQDPAVSGQRVSAPLPRVLQNALLSSHKHNHDSTYNVSAFFYLQTSLKASGKQFTCSVSHRSLRVPIRKSFILHVVVEEPSSWMYLYIFVGIVLMVVLVNKRRSRCHCLI